MQLQDLNWMDVEQYLQRDNRIILVTGATEQHAYLSLLTDVLIPSHIAEAAARHEEVLIALPLNFGVSPYFADFPGTITLSQRTFDLVLSEVTRSLLHQGFTRFLIMNGHGGNHMPAQLDEWQLEGLLRVVWYDWWRSEAVRAFEREHGLYLDHANWGEHFPFTRSGVSVPRTTKPRVNTEQLHEDIHRARDLLGDGSFGGPYQIDDKRMKDLFARVVEEVVRHLGALRGATV